MPRNQTMATELLLLGFQNLNNFQIPMLVLFIFIYTLIVCEHILVIGLVSLSKNLQSPMYFFLQQLSVSDLLQTTTVVPLMVQMILSEGVTLSLVGCFTQFYFYGSSESFQCLLLAIMSFDRYLAICRPLHYVSIMTHKVCVRFIVSSWILGMGTTLVTVNSIGAQWFCEQNIIDYFFCDFFPLVDLSCSNTFLLRVEVTLLSVPVVFCPFLVIIASYVHIVLAVLKIPSNKGRKKMFSTCSSHLAVGMIFYGTLTVIYVVPTKGQPMSLSKVLPLLYIIVTPLVNPLIYSLRSKDMKSNLKKLLFNRNRNV